MKKLLVLAVFGLFTLSSFSTFEKEEVKKSNTKLIHYQYWCANGNYGDYWHDGDLASAKKLLLHCVHFNLVFYCIANFVFAMQYINHI